MDSIMERIYQNAIDIQSKALQVVAWINEIRSKQDNIISINFDKHTQNSTSSPEKVHLNALFSNTQPADIQNFETIKNSLNHSDSASEIADCKLNNDQNPDEIKSFKEIMKRKFGKGSYCMRKIPQKYYKQFDNINLHSTRHTYASLAHYVGIDEKVIQKQLGHKTLAMTQDTYTDLLLDGNSVIKEYFLRLEQMIMNPRRT